MEQRQTIMMTPLLQKREQTAANKSKSPLYDVPTTARPPPLAEPILENCLPLPVAPFNQPSMNH
uniref:Uncharacterized protein n=1 Tax=Romanomermis culicivorax TaxID=13658 RepID=A0A915HUJ8_ROMCU